MRATINDNEIFLDGKQLPAVTLSVNKLTDPSKIAGVGSTTIKVLATREAKQALGTEFMAHVDRPGRPQLRIGDGGVDYFRSDVVVTRKDRDGFECVGIGGNATWFEYAKNTHLRQIPYGISPVITGDYQTSTWSTEEGLLYFPLVDYGGLEARLPTYNVEPFRLRPGVRLYEAIRIAMLEGGWNFRAMGRFATVCKRIFLLEPSAAPSIPIPEPYPVYDPVGGGGFLVPPYFVPGADGVLVVTAGDSGLTPYVASLTDPFDRGWDGYQFRVSVYDFTDKIALAYWDSPPFDVDDPAYGGVPLPPVFAVNVVAGHNIALTVEVVGLDGDGPNMSIYPANNVTYDLNGGAQTLVISVDGPTTFVATAAAITQEFSADTRLDIAQCLPAWTVMDAIRELSSAACLVFDTPTGNNVIQAWFDEEYFQRPTPGVDTREWTSRFDHTAPPAKVDTGLPARFVFKWASDEDDRMLAKASYVVDSEFGYGSLVLATNGTSSDLVLENKCAATAMGSLFGTISAPAMRQVRGEANVDVFDRTTRLLVSDGMAEGVWVFDGEDLTEFPRSYFSAKDSPFPFAYGSALDGDGLASDHQWKDRFARLSISTILECDVLVYDHEIQDFDHGMPTLVDDGSGPGWYYVQEIFQHQFGRNIPTKCLLVQIQGKEVALQFSDATATYPEIPALPDVGDFNNDFNNDFFNHA